MENDVKEILTDLIKSVKHNDASNARKLLKQAIKLKLESRKKNITKDL